jgi:molybdenum cofactor biosynthesis enzyme MoaA
VEIKVVPLRGINDSLKNYKQVLDFCSAHNFKFKFLNFEAITQDQTRYQINPQENLDIIQAAGAEKLPPDNKFRGQRSYLPLNWFKYKNVKGVVIEIGCGQAEVCKECANSNEIFIDPNLEIKPCHMSKFSIPLRPFIEKRQEQKILKALVKSRAFLSEKPGLGATHWLN